MAKLAVEVDRALARRAEHGSAGDLSVRLLAQGDGWRVEDVVCSSGPRDRAFQEQHSQITIALIGAGSFQYRTAAGHELMTPGSILLGSVGQCYECGHEHGAGDRCVAFHFTPGYFERLAADAGALAAARASSANGHGHAPVFRQLRLPPLRALSPFFARACAGVTGAVDVAWEELSLRLASEVVRVAEQVTPGDRGDQAGLDPSRTVARVTRAVRIIERRPDASLTLGRLAHDAGLSPFHFLRTFERLTGVTPHQYVLRARLREAALRLVDDASRVLDIALDCGFGDISNFNRAFRTEFGVTPRAYRRAG